MGYGYHSRPSYVLKRSARGGCAQQPLSAMARYVPPAGDDDWETVDPASSGFDATKLAQAVQFSIDNETEYCTPDGDMKAFLLAGGMHGAPEPEGLRDIVGPTRPRGATNGMILRGGRIVVEWGDTRRPDMTFSCTKSYLSTMVGLACADGILKDLDEPVAVKVHDGGFDSEHNAHITWRHLLHQSSEWRGELWGKPDSIDHNRAVNTKTAAAKGTLRQLHTPGSFYEYNDVRVNRLSLSVMRVLQRSLPSLLKERIMDPIGASDSWSWNGYSTSFEKLKDGTPVQGVSGGGHWGGGLFISTRDHARFGLLHTRGGEWATGQQLIPREWIETATEPSLTNHQYGAMWWLNTVGERGQFYPSVPSSSFVAQGAGGNYVWCEPSLDLVVVVRWCGDFKGFTERVMAALVGEENQQSGDAASL